MNILKFEIHNQTLIRVDSKDIINKNKNVYKCVFIFDENEEWINLNKFVLFTDGWGNTKTQHLGNNGTILSCLVPDSMLRGSYFKISVYAGDLVTTNNVSISLIQSGYKRPHHHYNHHNHLHDYNCNDNSIGGKDIFVEIFDRLDNTIDSIIYDKNTLHLFCREEIIESIYLPFISEDDMEQLVDNLTKDFILKIPLVDNENDGLMSSEDKVKLDSIEECANKTIIDNELSPNSSNPVENKVITEVLHSQTNRIDDFIDSHSDDFDEFNNRLDSMDLDLENMNIALESKEYVYDYVERLDNLIISLINKGE